MLSDTKEHTSNKKQQYYISSENTKSSKFISVFKAVIYFEEGCEMENIRAFSVIHKLKDISVDLSYIPEDIIDNDECIEIIKRDGFKVFIKTDFSYNKIHEFLTQTIFLKELELTELENDDELIKLSRVKQQIRNSKTAPLSNQVKKDEGEESGDLHTASKQQSIISVAVTKLDKLMDLVGEMVITESMVIQNPDLAGLELGNFQKAARQLHKITGEMQDMVMSIRMVPVATTFQKMHRIIRDMSKKLGKEIQLKLIGEETEVDKNIIEHISDPLMHLIRNAIDHGIELSEEERLTESHRSGQSPLKPETQEVKSLLL